MTFKSQNRETRRKSPVQHTFGNAKDAADSIGVSTSTFAKLRNHGLIPEPITIDGITLYDLEAIAAAIRSHA